MYIPEHFKATDKPKLLSFMQTYSFATLVTCGKDFPAATHLPFVTEEQNDVIILTTHMAAANPQSKELTGNGAMVIFREPHAYVSTKNYEKELNVPTWNYAAVHAYGNAVVLVSDEEKLHTLEKMISFYEKEYVSQWSRLPENYKKGMLKEIVAFKIHVTRLEGKFKLSQNRTKAEQQNIISAFESSGDSLQRQVADMMKENIERLKN